MADEYILKHLDDIRIAIEDLEEFFKEFPNRYDLFEKNHLLRCAVERKTEIMGEAMVRIRKHDPDFIIPHSKDVIATRNRLIHAYDSVKPEFLWGLVVRHIPELKKDIERLIKEELEKGSPDLSDTDEAL